MNNLSWKQKSIIDMIDSLDNWRESLSGRDYKVSMTTDPYLSFLTVTLFDLDKDGKASFGVVVRKTMFQSTRPRGARLYQQEQL